MKKTAILMWVLTGCEARTDEPQGKAKMEWRDGNQLDVSLREAKADGKSLMLYFTASW